MSMRRTTLGALTSLTNRNLDEPVRADKKRLSSAARFSMGRPPQESGGRLSGGGNRNSYQPRRSGSFYGKSLSARSDTRPISDKAYQHKCITKLINYLSVHNYDRPLAPKLLQSPTSKEFVNIVQFLFKRIEPTLQFGKMEEEVPGLFKRCGYPFAISKNSLCSVGSPLTWPSLLAALTWLVDLLESEERADNAKEPGNLGGGAEDFVLESYDLFLNGNDAAEREMEAESFEEYDRADEQLAAAHLAMEEELQKLESFIEKVESEPSGREQLEAERDDKRLDIAKFNTLMQNNLEGKIAMEKEKQKLEERRDAKVAELEVLVQETEQLQVKIQERGVNKEEYDRLLRELNSAKSAQEAVIHQKEQLQKRTWELEMQSSKQMEALETAVREYHTMGKRLKFIPSTAKRASGVEYSVEVNSRATDVEEVLSSDLKRDIKPALLALKKGFVERYKAAQEEMEKTEEKQFNSNEIVIEAQQKNNEIEAENKMLEAKLQVCRDSEGESAQELAEQLKDDVAKVKSAADQLVADAAILLKVTEHELELHVEQKERAAKLLRDKALDIAQMATGEKEYIHERLVHVHRLTKGLESDIESEAL